MSVLLLTERKKKTKRIKMKDCSEKAMFCTIDKEPLILWVKYKEDCNEINKESITKA